MENSEKDLLSHFGLEVDNEVKQQFSDAAKWSKFIAIVMFVACGLLLLFGIIGGSVFSAMFNRMGGAFDILGGFGGPVLVVIVLLIAAVIATVYYFLYAFAKKTQAALLSDSSTELNAGLKSLKTFFIITTVFAMISLALSLFNLFA